MKTVIVATALLLLTNAAAECAPPSARPAKWAQPVKLEGVPNLHKVSDQLYRSAQPTSVGMRNLKKLGIKTVINLRSFHSDNDEIGSVALAREHIYMKAWHPEVKEAERFLKIVMDPQRTPVLVHCQHGADRTGTMCALYRITIQGWSKADAIREMTKGGFGFHAVWFNLPRWIDKMDIESLRHATESDSATNRKPHSNVAKETK